MDKLSGKYTKEQLLQIKYGKESGVETSFYENPAFSPSQMQQIRLGLEAGLDVAPFAHPIYNWYQMQEISAGLYDKLDVTRFLNPTISHDRMRQIRLGLMEKIDLSKKTDLEAGIMEQIRLSVQSKIDIIHYVRLGYDAEQLKQIRIALQNNLPLMDYINTLMPAPCMDQIILGLKKQLNVSVFAKDVYNWQQMRQLRLGLESKLAIEYFSNPLYSWQKMQQIRLGLEDGLDVDSYAGLNHTTKQMESIHKDLLKAKEAKQKKNHKTYGGKELSLQISNEDMVAKIKISDTAIDTIRTSDISDFLAEKGIVYGILESSIEDAIKYKNSETYIVVAKGRLPISGEDGSFSLYFDTEDAKAPQILTDGYRDYSETKWFEIVPQNKVIAMYTPPTRGTEGRTIFGKVLPASDGKEKKISFGKNVVASEDNTVFTASLEGDVRYLKKKEKLFINPVQVFPKNKPLLENFYTKDSILIEGDLSSGVEIKSDGDIVIYGILGPSKIVSGGYVFIRGGVKGKDRCTITAKKDVISKFFESCNIHTEGNVIAGNILNCNIETEKSVQLFGDRSAIVGGVTKAEKGINTFNAGNSNLADTVFEVGKSGYSRRDFANTKKLIDYAEAEVASFESSIAKMKKHMSDAELVKDDTYINLKDAIAKKNADILKYRKKARELEEAISNSVEASITIRGTAFSGLKVYMAASDWEANNNRHIELSLSKNNYIRMTKLKD